MLAPKILVPQIIDRLPGEGYRYVFSLRPTLDPIQILSKWPWVGVVGARTYVVGMTRSDVSFAPVFASTAASTHSTGSSPMLPCNGTQVSVPLVSPLTALDVTSAPSDNLRIWLRDDLAPLPRVDAIFSRLNSVVHCVGADSISIVTTAS
jgi:hypothetical protein